MVRKVFLPLLAVVVALGGSAAAQSVSELLQEGIYTEETVGDLPAAVKIYQQIVADDKAARPVVAQAQYRLGMCQLKQGKKDETTKTFEDLVKRFPEQKEVVAEARKHLGGGLEFLPVPWRDGEALQMVVFLGAKEYGPCFLAADLVEVEGRSVWQLVMRTNYARGTNRTAIRVETDSQTFRPIRSLLNSSVLGFLEAKYGLNEVRILSKVRGKESAQKTTLDGVVYDDFQLLYLFRQLPLAEGYKVTVPDFSPMGGSEVPLTVEVTAKETVRVPAGEFECYKVILGNGITFWYSADARRYLIKMVAGSLSNELAVVQPPGEFRDEALGVSVSVPPGWFFYKEPDVEGPEILLSILDPDAVAISQLRAKKLESLKADEKGSARALAEAMLSNYESSLKTYKVRPNSWKDIEVAGRPAVTCLADYLDGEQKSVVWSTCVLGKATGSLFIVMIPAEKLEAFQKAFAPILETYKAN